MPANSREMTPFKEVTDPCSGCGSNVAILDRERAVLMCKGCGAESPALVKHLQPGRRVPEDHPWKQRPDDLLERSRAYHRSKARPLPANATRYGLRLQPDLRDDLNWLQANTGLTITEVIEDAVAAYRRSRDESHPFRLAPSSTLALPPGETDDESTFTS